VRTKWEVSYNTKYGQPGALAYKVDTLVVNRRIDETPRPVPEIIRLGSLKEIGDGLGLADSGKNRNDIRRALHQNAGAYITARRSYKGADGAERMAEISDTRCLVPQCDGVVFLPLPAKEALWDNFYTAAPARLRHCVERYNIVKKA
jgi:hypothetical protein